MNRPYRNFLVVGVQRTGSSALAELLNTHPAIAVGYEWTEHLNPLRKLQLLSSSLNANFDGLRVAHRDHIEASITPATQWLGFRRLFGASNKWLGTPQCSLKLLADRFAAHLNWLRAHPDVHLVHIVRNDHIGWLKSKYLARAMGNFIGGEYPPDARITIPIREAVARVRSKLWIDAQLAELASSNPLVRVEHEHFAAQLPELGAQIATFLGCDPHGLNPAATVIRRQSTRADSDYIANYADLVDAVAAIDTP